MAQRVLIPCALFALLAWTSLGDRAGVHSHDGKLDSILVQRAHAPGSRSSRVIVRTRDASAAARHIRAFGGTPVRHLSALGGQIALLPDSSLHAVAASPAVEGLSLDRPVTGTLETVGGAIGARWVEQHLGFDGRGVGVALIDSGVTAWHEDLDTRRVAHFADFVNFRGAPYDDYGHGSHVAGIIAGSGSASAGTRRGIAPGASLVVLKALDGAGTGYISNVLAALDYAIANRETYNIRVINLSVSAGVYESYERDPLTLAARRAVDAGIVVVAAAGNLGRNALGQPQRGGISAPGNAPWVLTVGAATHNGTIDRADDEVAAFSSRGPSAIDRSAKPDLVAPGVDIESIAEPSSVLFAASPSARRWGSAGSVSEPYLSLSGTSMAAPVAAATVALMIQANPALSPNAVKAILQFTAEARPGYDTLSQGAGFLNARGAVELAQAFAEDEAPGAPPLRDPVRWSREIIWGGRRVAASALAPGANAWRLGVTWGARTTPSGEPITWTAPCEGADCGGRDLPLAADAAQGIDVVDWSAFASDVDLVMAGSLVAPVTNAASKSGRAPVDRGRR